MTSRYPWLHVTGKFWNSGQFQEHNRVLRVYFDRSFINWGTPPNLGGGVYTYAANGLAAPVVGLASSGSGQALAITSVPGTPTDAANAWLGFGLGFGSCLDASSYTGVSFTVSGDLSTCTLALSANFSEDSSITSNPAFGSCTSSSCYSPTSAVLATALTQTTFTVPFASINIGGSPQTMVDTKAITGVQWNLMAPLDGSCNANFTIDDVKFVGQTAAPVTPLTVGDNNYITDGAFAGYGYTFTYNPNGLTDTVFPTCTDTSCTPALSAPLCASGTIGADVTYSTGAGLGFNLKQPAATANDPSLPQPIFVTGTGLAVDFVNRGGVQPQAQISDGTNYWCYVLSNSVSPVDIPWQSFNTACWDNSGSSFDPVTTSITSFDLVFPGEATRDVNFDACLIGIGTF